MRIEYTSMLDWEPMQVRFLHGNGPEVKDYSSLLDQLIRQWYASTGRENLCDCFLTSLDVFQADDGDGTVTAWIEWCCKHCLPCLLGLIESQFPEFSACIVGYSGSANTQDETHNMNKYIDHVIREIVLENGKVVSVPPFEIARLPVTNKEFATFARETSYQTSAERLGSNEVYYKNDMILGFDQATVDKISVTCVSYKDAINYCKWANVRLPSEAEWLAASILVDELYDDESFQKLFGRDHRFSLLDRPTALQNLSQEITATLSDDGSVVVRTGPRYVRMVDWEKQLSRHRWLVDQDFFDVAISFRTVRKSL